jgi:hypothetical protein
VDKLSKGLPEAMVRPDRGSSLLLQVTFDLVTSSDCVCLGPGISAISMHVLPDSCVYVISPFSFSLSTFIIFSSVSFPEQSFLVFPLPEAAAFLPPLLHQLISVLVACVIIP